MSTPPKPHLKLVSSNTIPPKRPRPDLGIYRHAATLFAGLSAAGIMLAVIGNALTIETGSVALLFAAVVSGSVLAGARKGTR